jgi:hypothetical protein
MTGVSLAPIRIRVMALPLMTLLALSCAADSGMADATDPGPGDPGRPVDVPMPGDIQSDPGTRDAPVDLSEETDASPVDADPDDHSETVDVQADSAIDALADVPLDAQPDVPPDVHIGPWRSLLYPVDWAPGFRDEKGRFLHDFSYAGYRNGEVPLPGPEDRPAFTATVTEYGADPAGILDSTGPIQAAIDAVADAGGGTVEIPAGMFRVEGSLTIRTSRTVIRGYGPEASRLLFTSLDSVAYQGHLRLLGSPRVDIDTPLARDGAGLETIVHVEDAGDLAPGDDVRIGFVITPEFVEDHGMTGTWKAFNDTWQPFFHRTVRAVDKTVVPHAVLLDVPLRYPVRVSDQASLRRVTGMLHECGIESLGIADAVSWEDAWRDNQVRVIEVSGARDCWIRDVSSFPSPLAPEDGPGSGAHLRSGGINIQLSMRITVADTVLGYAQNRGSGGNGYLFQIRTSSEILTRDCAGTAGRHNFIQNWGFGATGCVWLRIGSHGGEALFSADFPVGGPGYSEYHHSLATANLVDSSILDDGWNAVNRGSESTGAGHAATESVIWNATGSGRVNSYQYGWGYVIGTGPDLDVGRILPSFMYGKGTEPEDWLEGMRLGDTLDPPSLYEDQLQRRLEKASPAGGRESLLHPNLPSGV